MNNKGFAITTILYGTLILFCLLLVSMLGILSTYRNNLKMLTDNSNGARDIVTMRKQDVSSFNEATGRGLYCVSDECKYISVNGFVGGEIHDLDSELVIDDPSIGGLNPVNPKPQLEY